MLLSLIAPFLVQYVCYSKEGGDFMDVGFAWIFDGELLKSFLCQYLCTCDYWYRYNFHTHSDLYLESFSVIFIVVLLFDGMTVLMV